MDLIKEINLFRFSIFSNIEGLNHFITNNYNNQDFNIGIVPSKLYYLTQINRDKLCEILNIKVSNLVFAKQTHSSNIAYISSNNNYYNEPYCEADSIISENGYCPIILVADCVPILLFCKKTKLVAAIHAGWKGTQKNILHKTINKLVNEHNSKVDNILCAIGPSAGQCCYEVGDNVRNSFGEDYDYLFKRKYSNKYLFNLKAANYLQALQAGIRKENIEISDICTICNPAFYSFRRQGIMAGRMAAGIIFKKY